MTDRSPATARPRGESPAPDCAPTPTQATPNTLLLGLGNDLLTDDSVGLRVAAAVRERLADCPPLRVTETTEMGLALLDLIAGYQTLIVVDAIQTRQAPPGFVHEVEASDLAGQPPISPHFLGLTEVLALGRKLGLPVPNQVIIYAIEVQDPFTVGTGLTPALQAALPAVVNRIAAAVALLAPGHTAA
jgi:hydrogenase maturation protease